MARTPEQSDPGAAAGAPERIGIYTVVKSIAKGGMAAVYEVEDPNTGQRLAVKLLTQRGVARPRFSREYRALTRLDHPHIVRVYRYGVSSTGEPYLTMELLDGEAAQVYAKACGRPGTPRRNAEVLRIVAAVADALAYLHGRGILHRDLKSSNVLVLRDGGVKLLDFGTARLLDSHEEITRHGEFVGTFAYASPEQLTAGTVDARSDIYSLGVLFYRLLSGKRPFEAEDPHTLARQHLEIIPPAPAELVAGISPRISALVMQMLAKAPADRPDAAVEVAAVVRANMSTVRKGAPSRLSEPRVIGREEEVRALRSVFEKARPGRMVIVSGVAGSGRRRMLGQAVQDANALGWRTFEGSFPGPPGLGAIGEVARKVARGLPVPDGSYEDPDLALIGRLAGADPSDSAVQAQLYRAVSALLLRRFRHEGRPIALFLRALHRAPPLAVHALRVVRTTAAEQDVPVAVLATSTDVGDAPESVLRGQFPDATRVQLGPLDTADVGRLVGSVLGRSSPPPALARRIQQATGGMPGYVVEVVHSMVRQGLVEPRRTSDDRVEWRDRSGGRVAIPGSIRDVLSLSIAAVPVESLRVLEALAVAGGEATATVIAHTVEQDEVDVVQVLAALRGERLVEAAEDDLWRFRLGLTAQLVRERLRASRRHVLQLRLAEALLDAPPTPDKIRLLLAADHTGRAVEDAVHWAVPLVSDGRAAEVMPVLDRVVEQLPRALGTAPETRARLLLVHSRAAGRIDPKDPRASRSLDAAAALASGALMDEVDLARAGLLELGGAAEQARAALVRLRDRLGDQADPGLRRRVFLGLGRSHIFAGEFHDALVAYTDALEHATEVDDVRALGEARVGRGISHHSLGDLIASEADLLQGADAFSRIDNEQGRWHAASNLADLYRIECRFSEASDVIEPFLEVARQGTRPYRYAGLLINLAEVRIELVRLGEVRELVAELDSLGVVAAHPYISGALAMVRGRLLLASRDAHGAVDVLERAVRTTSSTELPVLAAQLRAWLGEAAAAAGDLDAGNKATREAVQDLRRLGHLPGLGDACACRSRAMGVRENPDDTFGPVLAWMNNQPARLARMTYRLSAAAWCADRNDQRGAASWYSDAAVALDEILSLQAPADRAALRVHPWRVAIDRSGRV